jgi:hypothetical protein
MSLPSTRLNKNYDKTQIAYINYTLSGTYNSDLTQVSLSSNLYGYYASNQVATGILVTISSIILTGPLAYNYQLSNIITGNIYKKSITPFGVNKLYDQTTKATITLSGTQFGTTQGVVNFVAGGTSYNVNATPSNPTTVSAAVPAGVYGNAAGSSVAIKFTNGDIFAKGELKEVCLPQGTLVKAGEIKALSFGEVDKASQLTVTISIEGTLARNQWQLWVYPKENLKIN